MNKHWLVGTLMLNAHQLTGPWVLRDGKRVADGWSFNYDLQPSSFLRKTNGARYAQAPGFLVVDDARIQTVTWSEFHHLFPRGTS